MNLNYKSVALFLDLSLVVASCQKENVVEQSVSAEDQQSFISVVYTVDDVTRHATFTDEESWRAFIHWMVALSEEGHRVSFEEDAVKYGMTKETVTYVTSSQSDAETWSAKMAKDGYRVSVFYDKKTNLYTCEATR